MLRTVRIHMLRFDCVVDLRIGYLVWVGATTLREEFVT